MTPPLQELNAREQVEASARLVALAKENEHLISQILTLWEGWRRADKMCQGLQYPRSRSSSASFKTRAALESNITAAEVRLKANNRRALELRKALAQTELSQRLMVSQLENRVSRFRSIVRMDLGTTTSSTVDIDRAVRAVPSWTAITIVTLFTALLAQQAAPTAPVIAMASLGVATTSLLLTTWKFRWELRDRRAFKREKESGEATTESPVDDAQGRSPDPTLK